MQTPWKCPICEATLQVKPAEVENLNQGHEEPCPNCGIMLRLVDGEGTFEAFDQMPTSTPVQRRPAQAPDPTDRDLVPVSADAAAASETDDEESVTDDLAAAIAEYGLIHQDAQPADFVVEVHAEAPAAAALQHEETVEPPGESAEDQPAAPSGALPAENDWHNIVPGGVESHPDKIVDGGVSYDWRPALAILIAVVLGSPGIVAFYLQERHYSELGWRITALDASAIKRQDLDKSLIEVRDIGKQAEISVKKSQATQSALEKSLPQVMRVVEGMSSFSEKYAKKEQAVDQALKEAAAARLEIQNATQKALAVLAAAGKKWAEPFRKLGRNLGRRLTAVEARQYAAGDMSKKLARISKEMKAQGETLQEQGKQLKRAQKALEKAGDSNGSREEFARLEARIAALSRQIEETQKRLESVSSAALQCEFSPLPADKIIAPPKEAVVAAKVERQTPSTEQKIDGISAQLEALVNQVNALNY
ncbi:MAG TPA: hypothetical protein VMX18_01665 [Candidatus Bipolaricaulota bacterium]|nr:hypothetical protein [Candidatus Bipolaricaulota bacterium]